MHTHIYGRWMITEIRSDIIASSLIEMAEFTADCEQK